MPWKQFNLYKGKNNSCHWLIFSSEFIVLLESLKTNPSFIIIPFFTLRGDVILVSLKKTSRVRRTRQGGLWISNLVKQFTFTISFDDLAILFRVNPVFPVSHLVPFTRFNLTTGFRRKFFDGSEGNYVRKNKFYVRSLRHQTVRYLLMRQERKKPPTFPACIKVERNKNLLILSDLD